MRVIGGLLGVLFVLAQVVFWSGTSLGVVREHCFDTQPVQRGELRGLSPAEQVEARLDLDSKWTYILWPPITFANIDPSGTCVRNSPLREGLDAIGIWELPPPRQQVIEHVQDQID